VALVVRLLFYPVSLFRSSRAALPSGWVALDLRGAIEDIPPPQRFWERRRRPTMSLHGLGKLATAIAEDPRARGLVVTLREARFGMATATSLREILARVRAAERRVIVYLPHGGGTKECYVALAGTEVLLGPQASLSPIGFAITTPYVRQGLAKLGVVPEVLARGRYKSAGESLVRDGMSEPQREQLEALIDGHYRALVAAIAGRRATDEKRAKEIVDGAPYMGTAAVKVGLADAVVYDDGLLERLMPQGSKTLVPAARYLARRRLRLGPVRETGVIGVVRVHENRSDDITGTRTVGDDVTCRVVREDRSLGGLEEETLAGPQCADRARREGRVEIGDRSHRGGRQCRRHRRDGRHVGEETADAGAVLPGDEARHLSGA